MFYYIVIKWKKKWRV